MGCKIRQEGKAGINRFQANLQPWRSQFGTEHSDRALTAGPTYAQKTPFTQFPLMPAHASSAAPSAKADALPAAAAVATRAAEGAGAAALAVPALGATQVPPAGRGSPSHATYIPVISIFEGEQLSDTLFRMWALPEAAVLTLPMPSAAQVPLTG